MELRDKALPARSSRPSQGEGEITLRLCFVEGEISWELCFVEVEVGSFTFPQGGSLRRNDEAGRETPYGACDGRGHDGSFLSSRIFDPELTR